MVLFALVALHSRLFLLSFLFLFFNLIMNIDSERQSLDEKQTAQLNTVITKVSGLIDLSNF